MEEIWKDIPDFVGEYQVSNLGRVKSLRHYYYTGRLHANKKLCEEMVLTLSTNNAYGSQRIKLKGKQYMVHRLVAKAFPEICGEWFDGCQVHHIDENPANNAAFNLKVLSKEEHIEVHLNSTRYQKMMETRNKNSSHGAEKPVFQFDKNGCFIKEWRSAREAAKSIGGYAATICGAIRGYTKTAYGFYWSYSISQSQ